MSAKLKPCEVATYNFSVYASQRDQCTAPQNCADVGVMCQKLYQDDDDRAACVRANSFAVTGGAVPAANSLCALRSTCCGKNQQCQWKDNTCLSSTGESVSACSQYDKKETCDSKNCSTDYLSYTCIWDADLQKGVHYGPHTKGVCNPKDPDNTKQDTSMCAKATTKDVCDDYSYCKWDDKEHDDTQSSTLETEGCYPGQDNPGQACKEASQYVLQRDMLSKKDCNGRCTAPNCTASYYNGDGGKGKCILEMTTCPKDWPKEWCTQKPPKGWVKGV